jgi:hypothetical protein
MLWVGPLKSSAAFPICAAQPQAKRHAHEPIHTRVELHGASERDYENLHVFMEGARFRRSIDGGDGRQYELPTATYYSFGSLSVVEVRQLALNAAARTGRAAWVLATEAKGICWQLRPIAAPANALAGFALS